MLYHFFHDLNIEMPGVGLWSYISFRAGLALILSLFISTIIGKRIIDYLKLKQMGELVRNLGLEGENSKYRMFVFVPEKEEQMQGIKVPSEHCYVLKNNDEYEFYLYSKEGE